MEKINEDLLKSGIEHFHIDFDEKKICIFKEYLEQIKFFNKITNITSVVEEKEIVIKHFIDSISSNLVVNYRNQKIVDIGTGSAGFPGIPLKILFPELEITFIDSSVKKTEILRKISNNLKLTGVNIISDNVEKIGRHDSFREKFDIAVLRAIGNIRTLVEYGIPLLKTGGNLVIYKGSKAGEEVENSQKALEELKSKIVKNVDIILPFSDYNRKIIVVEKLGITDYKYPRRTGIPKKKPL